MDLAEIFLHGDKHSSLLGRVVKPLLTLLQEEDEPDKEEEKGKKIFDFQINLKISFSLYLFLLHRHQHNLSRHVEVMYEPQTSTECIVISIEIVVYT